MEVGRSVECIGREEKTEVGSWKSEEMAQGSGCRAQVKKICENLRDLRENKAFSMKNLGLPIRVK